MVLSVLVAFISPSDDKVSSIREQRRICQNRLHLTFYLVLKLLSGISEAVRSSAPGKQLHFILFRKMLTCKGDHFQ